MRAPGGVPASLIQRMKWRCGLGLSVGELVALVRGVAQRGQEEYHQLQEEIRASPVVYGDETGWREDGRNGYLWSFSTPKVRCFLRRASRGGPVVEEVLGDEFDGVLVSDFYGAQRASRAASAMLDPPAAGHPPTEGETLPTPGSGRMGPTAGV